MSFRNTHTPAKPTGKAKWQVPQRPGKRNNMEFYLEGELKEKFCKLFPIHSNLRMMQWFGISFSVLQRFKRQLGLRKDMKAIRKELAKDVKKICEKNGYYDSLRGKRPSEQCFAALSQKFRDGWHPLKVIKEKNPRRYQRMMKERSQRRIELIKSERKRVSYGLTPYTKLTPWLLGAVRKFTRPEISKRYNALKHGYILGYPDTERYCIFYDSDTRRSELFENNCTACGFTIAPLPKH